MCRKTFATLGKQKEKRKILRQLSGCLVAGWKMLLLQIGQTPGSNIGNHLRRMQFSCHRWLCPDRGLKRDYSCAKLPYEGTDSLDGAFWLSYDIPNSVSELCAISDV
ncbi:hypothetical protein AVEN_267561-1 [Araneus ventricosus]|uniref:Uncharacterized protein n=1 Tax=Araneus ventricosus TaxID=182803 RepID=A0A4Y2IJK2_ARAVE|nr:hypothetical protein AVEN_267561-1 [Araneus ventricosus]